MCLMSWKPTWKTMWWVSSNTRNMLRVSSVHTTLEKFEKATITGHLGFVFEENSGRDIIWLSWRYRFRKAFFAQMFSVRTKTQSRRFQIRSVYRAFSKSCVQFPWIDVDGRLGLTVGIKLRFQISPAQFENKNRNIIKWHDRRNTQVKNKLFAFLITSVCI